MVRQANRRFISMNRIVRPMTQTHTQNNVAKPGLFGRVRAWFFTGLLVTAPVLLTVYITWAAIKLIDLRLVNFCLTETSILGNVPGVGLVVGAVLITLIGAIAPNLGRYIIRLVRRFNRMPLSGQFMVPPSKFWKRLFRRNRMHFVKCFAEYPRRELWVIGFVTGNTKGEVAGRIASTMVNVFVPTTPNPTSGFLLFCHADVIFLKNDR